MIILIRRLMKSTRVVKEAVIEKNCCEAGGDSRVIEAHLNGFQARRGKKRDLILMRNSQSRRRRRRRVSEGVRKGRMMKERGRCLG